MKLLPRVLVAATGALLALTGAGVAWKSHRQAQEMESAQSVAEAEKAAAIAAWRVQQERQAAALTTARATPVPSVKPAPDATPPPRQIMGPPRDNPELQARAVETFKTGLAAKYASFYRALGLSPAQIAAFEAMLVEHEGRLTDLRATERGRPPDPATAVREKRMTVDGREVEVLVDGAIAALRREEEARFHAAQVSLLGEAGAAQLRDYDASGESRRLVGELAGALAFSAHPLQAEQGRQLVRLLREGNYAERLGAMPPDWERILRRAAGVLAPGQLAELEELAARTKRDTASQQLSKLVSGR